MAAHRLNHGIRSLTLLGCLAQLYACGAAKDGSDTGGFTTANLVGTWKSGCLAVGTTASEDKQIVFTNETFSFKTTTYTDTACATVDNVLAGSGTYELNGMTTLDKVGDVVNIDYTYAAYTWTFTAEPLRAVDYAKACGSTNLSGSVNVLGKTCALDGTTTSAFNSPAYGTLAMEGETLLLSDLPSAGAAADARSTSGIVLGQKLGWTKQPEPAE